MCENKFINEVNEILSNINVVSAFTRTRFKKMSKSETAKALKYRQEGQTANSTAEIIEMLRNV